MALSPEGKQVPGAGSEPVELRPGLGVLQAAREAELERWAWKRVRALRAFYTHMSLYAGVNFGLMLVDLFTPGGPWFYWVLLGWGLGAGLHAVYTYESLPWFTRDWERRKVEELMEEGRRQ